MASSVGAAFDSQAADYDRRFSMRWPAEYLRETVRLRVASFLEPGMRVLELGCGTGCDAVWLAEQNCEVTAIDASAAMLGLAERRVVERGLQSRITLHHGDAGEWLSSQNSAERFDAVFSNFGVLNCIADVPELIHHLANRLSTRGRLVFVVMGRFCLLETLLFASRGRFADAVRRWSGAAELHGGAQSIPVYYYTPRALTLAASGLTVEHRSAIGALLPPSEGFNLCDRWPGLFRKLAVLDRRWGRWLWPISDHYMLVLTKS